VLDHPEDIHYDVHYRFIMMNRWSKVTVSLGSLIYQLYCFSKCW